MTLASQSKWVIAVIASVATCAVLGLGTIAWHAHTIKAEEERSYQAASELLASNHPAEALALIDQRNQSAREQTPEARTKWLALEIETLEQMGQVPRLRALYERTPESFGNQEKAVLRIGRAMLRGGELDGFDQLRAAWRLQGTNAAAWFDLDVDELLRKGRREEAAQLLNSRSFPGKGDCGRLARLALLNTPGDLKTAWEYLDRATALNPRNPEVRLFRAEILEGAGKRESANAEYLAAQRADPNDAFIRNQLAEFYRRGGNYDLAVLTWAEGLTNSASTDLIWLKALFWTRVARAVQFDWSSAKPALGNLQPLVSYLLSLPRGGFWDEAAFEKVPEARRFEQQYQEIFWLKLLGNLQAGEEDQAFQRLQNNRFRPDSWNADLESALMRVLVYRRTGELKFPVGSAMRLNDAPPKSRHQLLELIDHYTRNPNEKLPADLDRLLRGKEAFAAVVLAGGWSEAALDLTHIDVVPDDSPEWVAFGFTQAYRFNRGNAAALAFAAKQTPTPALEYLTGEILIADGQVSAGLLKLSEVAKADSDVGARAAWLVAQTYASLKQYTLGRNAIEAQPRLKQSVTGKELLARLALAQDDQAQAEEIYSGIEGESDEAKAFLAGVAFQQKNWPRARALTEELLKKYPERSQLRANLEAIAKAEADKNAGSGKTEQSK